MAREDEVFEVLCAALRSARDHGTEFAQARLQELAGHTSGECFAAKTPEVVGQVNRPSLKLRATKRIFQIAYDKGAGIRRAELLRQLGYGVISVIGNEAAKVLLTSTKPYDLFIVGHAAPEQTRREMVDWLRADYPNVKILALNSTHGQLLGADYNVIQNEFYALLKLWASAA